MIPVIGLPIILDACSSQSCPPLLSPSDVVGLLCAKRLATSSGFFVTPPIRAARLAG